MNKKKGIIIGAVLFFLVVVVGYAIFSDTLTINGTATAKGEFDIEFNRVNSVSEIGSKGATAEISEDKNTLTINASKLEYPSSYVEVDVTIKNIGSINAVLKGIEVQGVENPDIKVTYTGIIEDEILGSNQEKDMKIKVLWDEESTATDVNASFTIKIVYEQYNGTEIPPTTSPSKVYNVGDEFCIDTECFYVIKDNGDSVTALAKDVLNISENKQVYPSASDPVAFAETIYWFDFDDGKYLPKYDNSDIVYYERSPVDVYDSNSLLYEHVENYESYLKSLGKTSVSARLITYDELVGLGCEPDGRYTGTCENAPIFLWDGAEFWTGSAFAEAVIVLESGYYSDGGGTFEPTDNCAYLRPVITISKTEI